MTPSALRASTTCLAVDARTRDHAGAEHLVHVLDGLLPVTDPAYVASTHLVPGDAPHKDVATSWPSAHTVAEEELLELVAARVGELLDVEAEVGLVLHGHDGTASRGPEELVSGALRAGGEHRARSAGRLARYAGQAEVERRRTVAEVLALSAIDDVEALAGTDVRPDTLLDLTEWARPTWRAGRAVLLVQPGLSALVPFESRHQIPCCADH